MKGRLAKVSNAKRVLKCNRLKPVPVGGFIGILPPKTTGGVSQGITLFSRASFFSKKWGILIPGTRQKKQQQANKQKQKQKTYLTTRPAALEHLLQLCQKKNNDKANRKSISFYSIAV